MHGMKPTLDGQRPTAEMTIYHVHQYPVEQMNVILQQFYFNHITFWSLDLLLWLNLLQYYICLSAQQNIGILGYNIVMKLHHIIDDYHLVLGVGVTFYR